MTHGVGTPGISVYALRHTLEGKHYGDTLRNSLNLWAQALQTKNSSGHTLQNTLEAARILCRILCREEYGGAGEEHLEEEPPLHQSTKTEDGEQRKPLGPRRSVAVDICL